MSLSIVVPFLVLTVHRFRGTIRYTYCMRTCLLVFNIEQGVVNIENKNLNCSSTSTCATTSSRLSSFNRLMSLFVCNVSFRITEKITRMKQSYKQGLRNPSIDRTILYSNNDRILTRRHQRPDYSVTRVYPFVINGRLSVFKDVGFR